MLMEAKDNLRVVTEPTERLQTPAKVVLNRRPKPVRGPAGIGFERLNQKAGGDDVGLGRGDAGL